MRERASERSKDEDEDEEGRKEVLSFLGGELRPSPFSPSTTGASGGRNERCKVIKANVHHLVGDLKARNFL